MTLFSRISNRPASNSDGPVLPSSLSDPANNNDRFVPDTKRAGADARFCCPWPGSTDLRSLKQVFDFPAQAIWSEWMERSPLVANLDEEVQMTPVEECLGRNLRHLKNVFRNPSQHLRTVRERVPVSQARRVPEAAIPDLIAHPEDWERRTARGIRPIRLLSQRAEDDLDLYENRIAVRLVDELLDDLTQRIPTLRLLLQLQESGLEQDNSEEHHVAQHGSHWRRGRLYKLWGRRRSRLDASRTESSSAQPPHADTSIMTTRSTLANLEHLRRALITLQDTRLYRSVSRRATLLPALRPTNILNNDLKYRKVAEIWRQWVAAQEPELSPTERLAQRRRESAVFDSYGLLLVLHALHDLGWSAEAAAAIRSGSQLLLQRHGVALRMSLDPDGAVTLSMDDQRLRIVPVLCGVTPEHRSVIANSIRAEASGDVLVLLLGQPEQLLAGSSDGDATSSATPDADSRLLAGWGQPTVLLVSPFTLDSQERVARALSSWLAQHALPSYPPRLPLNADTGVTLPRWLRVSTDRSHIEVVEPASEAEIAAFRTRCEDRRRAIESEARRTRVRGMVDPRPAALDNLLLAAQHAATLRVLQKCQVCGGSARFEARLDGGKPTWWCRCQDCDAEWGTRPCSGCQQPFPVLVAAPDFWVKDRSVDWLDRSFGRDLWSEPCWDPARQGSFRCPHCGNCGQDGPCSACSPSHLPA